MLGIIQKNLPDTGQNDLINDRYSSNAVNNGESTEVSDKIFVPVLIHIIKYGSNSRDQ